MKKNYYKAKIHALTEAISREQDKTCISNGMIMYLCLIYCTNCPGIVHPCKNMVPLILSQSIRLRVIF